jgi:hypothetical protein
MIWSALAFAAAMLSKEAAVVFPVFLLGWLYLTRRPLGAARFHWLALAAYIIYRGTVLSTLEGGTFTEDLVAWTFQPWLAFVFPGVSWHPSWTWVAGAFFVAVLALALRSWRATLPWVAVTLMALATTLPVYQLSPDFQFGRFLYLALAGWAAIVAVAIKSVPRAKPPVLAAYAICLLLVGMPSRSAMASAGERADPIAQGVAEQVRDLPTTAVVLVEDVPIRHQGWVLFGGYLELATRRAANLSFLKPGWTKAAPTWP